MKLTQLVTILLLSLTVSACSSHIKEPALSFGKKCAVTENGQVTYSYVWLYDKKTGLKATKEECKKIDD